MHYLQKAILDKLRYESPLNYSALMPDGIESSHFRYHLKLLVSDGLVNKNADGHYGLTSKGEREVDYLSSGRTTIVRTPKAITYTLLTHQDRLLLYKKPKEPYRSLLGLVGGKLHFGEDAPQAAQREVHEKVGLTIPLPTLRGVADIIILEDTEPLSHVAAYVHTFVLPDLPAALPKDIHVVQAAELDAFPLAPDLHPLLEAIETQVGTVLFVKQIRCQL